MVIEFVERVDVVIYDIESVNVEVFKKVVKEKLVILELYVLEVICDKYV